MRQNRLKVVEAFDVDATKTSALVEKLKGLDLGKRPLIVTEDASEHLYLSARNLPYVEVRDVQGLDPAALVGYIAKQGTMAKIRPDHSVFLTRDLPTPEKRLSGAAVVMTQLAELAKAAG